MLKETRKRDTHIIVGGDSSEGTGSGHKFFDADLMVKGCENPERQVLVVEEMLKPHRKKIITWREGNHERRYRREGDFIRNACKRLGVPYGGVTTHLTLGNGVRLYCAHGNKMMPRGAKDPVQKEANQLAWLKNQLAPMASDCHAMFMEHTHQLKVLPPQSSIHMGQRDGKMHAAKIVLPAMRTDLGFDVIPVSSRWYVNAGTMRTNFAPGAIDYAEEHMFAPAEIGYVIIHIRNGSIEDIEKVVV